MGEKGKSGKIVEHVIAMQNKKTNHSLGTDAERDVFNPVRLTDIGKDEGVENKINEIQENLGPEITEKESKFDHSINIGQYLESAKKTVSYGYTEEIEKCGDIAFGTGHLNEAIEAYEEASTWGSTTASKKLFEVVKYIFDKPEHICDCRHNSSGCYLRSRAIKSLKSLDTKESKEHLQKYLFEIGEINERKKRYHCAVTSYSLACERGSLEAGKKLAELGKTLKSEYPYLALIASKYANMREMRE